MIVRRDYMAGLQYVFYKSDGWGNIIRKEVTLKGLAVLMGDVEHLQFWYKNEEGSSFMFVNSRRLSKRMGDIIFV